MQEKINFLEQDIKKQLIVLKNGFKDEIPDEIIHSNAVDNKFKVRRAWFQGVSANFSNALDEGQITDPDLIKEIKEFINYVTSEDFHHKERTEKKDIDWANSLIEKVLGKIK